MESVRKVETKPQKCNKKRVYYESVFKNVVVKYSDEFGNRAAARKYDIDESNVRRWKKDRERLRLAIPKRKSFTGPRRGRFHQVELQVVQWINEQRAKAMPVSRKSIKIKALRIARDLNIGREQFKASFGWCKRLMRRHGLSIRRRTTLAQKLPNDYTDKLLEYQRYVIKLRKQHNYPLNAMGNADETPVFFDMPGNTTVTQTGVKSVPIRTSGNEKLRISVMLTVLADGGKLPPFIILKRKKLPKEELPHGIFVRCQDKGWMTSELLSDWLKCVWKRRPGASAQSRALLSLDAFRGHLHEDFKKQIKACKTDLVIIPGGMTSVLQVLDVVVNKPFKDYLKEQYEYWLVNHQHEYTKAGNIKRPSIRQMCEWIVKAWNQISEESIRKGFKKCCISNALDGSEDDVLWEDHSKDNVQSNSESESNSETESEVSENEDVEEVSDFEDIETDEEIFQIICESERESDETE